MIALLDSADAAQWQTWTKDSGWRILTAPIEEEASLDKRVQALAAKVAESVQGGAADPARVYIAGRGEAAAAVFYAIARIPDRWTAGVALGGSPKAAIETNRIFAVNFNNAPVLWASAGPEDQSFAEKLKAAGINVTWRPAAGLTNAALLQWLGSHVGAETPLSIDCETNSPTFGSCYWIQMTKFDAAERNDVLTATLVPSEPAPILDVGAFSYKGDDPGPGVGIVFLPERYSGPLKVGDRIVSLDGKPIENSRHYLQMIAQATESRNAVIMVQRAKDRIRIETRILVPRRDPVVTARVKANYLPEYHQIEIITRSVTEMRVTVPPAWIPGDLLWNGLTLENVKTAGCYALKIEKELLRAGPCQ